MSARFSLDAIDGRLLEQMQADARMSVATLADRVGLSEAACYRRLRILRSKGVIDREIAIVRPKVLGWPLSMLVLVTLERERTQSIARLTQALSQCPQVVDIWYVTGGHDFVLRIIARNMEEYDSLTRELLNADESVRSFETLVVMRHVKELGPMPDGREID